ncbi:phage terminase small subunit P27 family [Catellatospora sichuanensis]|uniref:phage terminase small subunit P27 family n=1 Tax=Catellatospora sichuanensis TaxID=1969805 RepID=UPI0016425515|nr:phage terminase small subunit P27 family [Catellatospora sichuanensis]
MKLIQGNPSKDSSLGETRKSATGVPAPPADLRGEAYAEWCRITAFLASAGHVEKVDHAALVVYCSAWGMFDQARRAMDEHGPLVLGRDGGYVRNPAAQVMNDASKIMMTYGSKFGFTPRDRINLGMTKADDGDDIERHLAAL